MPNEKTMSAEERAKFIDSSVQMFGKRGSAKGKLKIIEFIAAELEAYAAEKANELMDAERKKQWISSSSGPYPCGRCFGLGTILL